MEEITDVLIHTEFIKLQQIIKLSGIVGQGSDVKVLLNDKLIYVNNMLVLERGKKIYSGDVIEVKNMGKIRCVVEK
jgi:Uncharacterized conserved protein